MSFCSEFLLKSVPLMKKFHNQLSKLLILPKIDAINSSVKFLWNRLMFQLLSFKFQTSLKGFPRNWTTANISSHQILLWNQISNVNVFLWLILNFLKKGKIINNKWTFINLPPHEYPINNEWIFHMHQYWGGKKHMEIYLLVLCNDKVNK